MYYMDVVSLIVENLYHILQTHFAREAKYGMKTVENVHRPAKILTRNAVRNQYAGANVRLVPIGIHTSASASAKRNAQNHVSI